jgi:hypothetical protein
LSFVALGDGDDASQRVDEIVGRAVREHKLPWLAGQ